MLALEDDGDALVRLQWNVYETVALDIADRMGLLTALVAANAPRTIAELAQECQVEDLLTSRVLRTLDAYGCIDSQLKGTDVAYSANNITRLTTTERGKIHMRWWTRTLNPIMFKLPQKLQDNNFKSLVAGQDTVFNDVRGKPGLTFFELLTADEVASFRAFMPLYNMEAIDWIEFYPVQERLIDGAKTGKDSVFFLDIGGSGGHQADALRRRYPDVPGRFVVQDLADVLKGIMPGLEPMEHDFLTPKPVKGARVYYLRNIMHDWHSDISTQILKHVGDAMEPGYSRVLIQEFMVPDRHLICA